MTDWKMLAGMISSVVGFITFFLYLIQIILYNGEKFLTRKEKIFQYVKLVIMPILAMMGSFVVFIGFYYFMMLF